MDYLVLHAPRISSYLEHPFPDGSTALDHVARRLELLRSLLSSTTTVYVVCGAGLENITVPQSWNIISVQRDGESTPSSAAAFRALDTSLPQEDGTVLV